ncbi:hypothetical protein PUR61_08440 [Streptomyces sp. BE20]|uniref:hypothetical protein n=1 Tax=Streptomyces sp. BE20 TaxID=3002525 RepID=UPI002E79A5AE|nr:hypothetical protein [Streptomyces sp. BE20]MEE1822222.1 hypothetical protein [Streptomyces sp. BE20]
MTKLVLDTQVLVNFRHHDFTGHGPHGYRWVDVKSFRFPQGIQDSELLAALVAHEQFRDDYAGGGVDPAGMHHGPYWLKHVTAHAYRPVASAEALCTLRSWAGQHGSIPVSLEETLASTVHALIDSATNCYHLQDRGRQEFHDWGGVHIDFHEYVVIDQDRTMLTLLVAADD